MTFKEYILEHAVESSIGKNAAVEQIPHIINHLIKLFIGQDSISAQKGKDWEKQINGAFENIRTIKLKNNKKIKSDFLNTQSIIFINSINENKINSLKQVLLKNHDKSPLYKPDNIEDLKNIISEITREMFEDIQNDKTNVFKNKFDSILQKIKSIDKSRF